MTAEAMSTQAGWRVLGAALVLVATACTGEATDSPTTTAPVSTTDAPTTTTIPVDPVPRPARIEVRTVEGTAEFFDPATGTRFVPRGVNYVDFRPSEHGDYRDAVFATDSYDSDRVREAFSALSDRGYNTVRIFFDTCGIGAYCLGNPAGRGLNPEYLDNMVDLMWVAASEGIRILFTANSIPDTGGYWERYFDPIFNRSREGFTGRENADWLHEAGVETKVRVWDDLLSGLADRHAPFETVLGWQLTNEFWLWRHEAPMSLESGFASTANGNRYDMADPEAKRQMVIDGVVHFVDRVRAVIDVHDPEALVTMGFFAPFLETHVWYVDPAPLLAVADLDFFDFHAYHDGEFSIRDHAEALGMIGYTEKPIIMGETGSGHAIVPSAFAAASHSAHWYAESCEVGFDGWLNWGYYPWPDEVGGAPWTFLDADGHMLDALAPVDHPDACVVPDGLPAPLNLDRPITASRSLADAPPHLVVDGGWKAWNSGGVAPQWIEFDLASPATVGSIAMTPEMWPPGVAHHRVWATLVDGRRVLIGEIRRTIAPDARLTIDLAAPLHDVDRIRVETLSAGNAWVAWREVSVDPASSDAEACLVSATMLHSEPTDDSPAIDISSFHATVAEARYGPDPTWARVAGDRWVEIADADCPDLMTVDGPVLDLVEVEFRVRVPAGTGTEVFLAGLFGADLPPWSPYTALLLPEDSLERSVIMLLERGTTIEYVYTRGGFDTIERPTSCGETDPRTATVSVGLILEDTVVAWQDTDCG
jgi:hypothetical protein